MIRVLICDDHPIVLEGLRQIIEDTPDMKVSGKASNSQEVVQAFARRNCDVVILDLTMPGRNGLDSLKELKKERPSVPVLILSMHPEEQFAVRTLKAGADGYLTKESAPEKLIEAIRKVYEGGKYLSMDLAEQLAIEIQKGPNRNSHEILSDREFQVLRLLAKGKTITDIAADLAISVKTVSTYRSRILEKINIKTNVEMTHYAIQHGLMD